LVKPAGDASDNHPNKLIAVNLSNENRPGAAFIRGNEKPKSGAETDKAIPRGISSEKTLDLDKSVKRR